MCIVNDNFPLQKLQVSEWDFISQHLLIQHKILTQRSIIEPITNDCLKHSSVIYYISFIVVNIIHMPGKSSECDQFFFLRHAQSNLLFWCHPTENYGLNLQAVGILLSNTNLHIIVNSLWLVSVHLLILFAVTFHSALNGGRWGSRQFALTLKRRCQFYRSYGHRLVLSLTFWKRSKFWDTLQWLRWGTKCKIIFWEPYRYTYFSRVIRGTIYLAN